MSRAHAPASADLQSRVLQVCKILRRPICSFVVEGRALPRNTLRNEKYIPQLLYCFDDTHRLFKTVLTCFNDQIIGIGYSKVQSPRLFE